jgi:hypothetical protein
MSALNVFLEILERVNRPEGGEFVDIKLMGVLDPAVVNALTKQSEGSTCAGLGTRTPIGFGDPRVRRGCRGTLRQEGGAAEVFAGSIGNNPRKLGGHVGCLRVVP